MKTNLFFILILFSTVLSAQTFIETSPATPITGASHGEAAFSDIDGDGDLDVLISGRSPMSEQLLTLYTNDGTGTFTEVPNTPFEGVEFCSVAFADIDNDMDQDLFITGRNSATDKSSKLYINDGGSFTEVMSTPFENVFSSAVAFADVDGDDDQDLLITGYNNTNDRVAKLYTNVGGTFTEVEGTVFDPVQHNAIAFADVDGDNDQDVLITGQNILFENIAKLYTNDGTGVFTEVMNTSISGVEFGDVAFADIDNDNDPDLFIIGREIEDMPIAKLYTNDGGNFTEATGSTFDGVDNASLDFADVDGDNDIDVLIAGRNSSIMRTTKLYINNAGDFTELADNPFVQITSGAVSFADIDNDNDPDVLVTGLNGTNTPSSIIYRNDWMVSASEPIMQGFDFNFSLYPNPSGTDKMYINYTVENNATVLVKIFDLNGRLLIQEQVKQGVGQQTLSMNISSLSKGSYIVQLMDGEKIAQRKFLVQ